MSNLDCIVPAKAPAAAHEEGTPELSKGCGLKGEHFGEMVERAMAGKETRSPGKVPSSKHQTVVETPNSKNQTPKKLQTSKSKTKACEGGDEEDSEAETCAGKPADAGVPVVGQEIALVIPGVVV